MSKPVAFADKNLRLIVTFEQWSNMTDYGRLQYPIALIITDGSWTGQWVNDSFVLMKNGNPSQN